MTSLESVSDLILGYQKVTLKVLVDEHPGEHQVVDRVRCFFQRLFSVRKLQGELLNEKEPLPTIGTDAFCTLRKKNTLLPPNDLS